MDGDFFFGTSSLCEIQNDKINNFSSMLLFNQSEQEQHNPPLLSDLFDGTMKSSEEIYTPSLHQKDDETFGSLYPNEMDKFLLKYQEDCKEFKNKKVVKKEQRIYNPGEIITLKRGRKLFNDDEKIYSKNDFIKYYQNIWRLLFRKNSTNPLSNYGKACCSYYANKTFTQCPSGKSPIHDLFRTFEHIWTVIDYGKELNIAYGLTHFFFMKALIPWKKQTRFTVCPSKPDIEPLENDRVFQNGKYRTFMQEENVSINRTKNKKELETMNEQILTLWNLIYEVSGYEIPLEKTIPNMDLIMNVLQNLILADDSYKGKTFSWPINPMELNFQEDEIYKNIYYMAKILSLYGSLIRKSKHFQISKGEIAAMPNIIFRKEDFFIVQQPKLGLDFLQDLPPPDEFLIM